mgnify:CR=1 FL=1
MKVDVKYILFAATLSMGLFTSCTSSEEECKLPQSCHGLNMTELPQRWDEAIPLGNGLTGGLLWQKDGKLRLAIDRADLWDLRPVEAFKSPDHTYRFICDQVIHKKDMRPVYALIDDRTANDPAPTKIPAGALEFDIHKLGKGSGAGFGNCGMYYSLGEWCASSFFYSCGGKRGAFPFCKSAGYSFS